jgi:integrase
VHAGFTKFTLVGLATNLQIENFVVTCPLLPNASRLQGAPVPGLSTSTHNQAQSALLFLYREVLNLDLPWMDGINRPAAKRRIPRVLTKDEVAGVLAQMEGITALLARLLYGTGMRLMEGIRLRVKDSASP